MKSKSIYWSLYPCSYKICYSSWNNRKAAFSTSKFLSLRLQRHLSLKNLGRLTFLSEKYDSIRLERPCACIWWTLKYLKTAGPILDIPFPKKYEVFWNIFSYLEGKIDFCRILKLPALFSHLFCTEKVRDISKPCKNRALEHCSNIFFPLGYFGIYFDYLTLNLLRHLHYCFL